MRKPLVLLFTALAFVIIFSTRCSLLWDIGREVVRSHMNTNIDTTGTYSGAFSLSYYPRYPGPHEEVHFALATRSTMTYNWDFGDGETVCTSAHQVSHQYTKAGNYTVTVSGGTHERKQTTSESVYVSEP